MPKKSLKEAAAAGTSVFDTIAAGGAQRVEHAQNAQDVHNAQAAQNAQNAQNAPAGYVTPAAKPGRPKKSEIPLVRLNLRIPEDIREYLQAAAYRESSPKKTVSLTEYLCQLVREDMERHKDD